MTKAKVYEFVIAPSGGHEVLFGENLYILVDNEDELRGKFDKWAEKNYSPNRRYGSGERPLPLEEIWNSRNICSNEQGDGIFARDSLNYIRK